MMNPAKFGSSHLDTPSTRYGFLKFAFKPMKINKENQISNRARQLGAPGPVHSEALTAGPAVNATPHVIHTKAGQRFDWS